MSDPREALINSLDIDALRIERPPRIFFLCGGNADIRHPTPQSLRRALIDLAYRIGSPLIEQDNTHLAEDFKDWLNFGIYRDLSTFELHLAELSSLIILILESAGSLAELGAFASIGKVSEKLVVIVNDKFSDHDSYINHGPLRYLEERGRHKIKRFPWEMEPFQIEAEVLQDIHADILAEAEKSIKTARLNKENSGHLMCLIAEFIDLCIAASVARMQCNEIRGIPLAKAAELRDHSLRPAPTPPAFPGLRCSASGLRWGFGWGERSWCCIGVAVSQAGRSFLR